MNQDTQFSGDGKYTRVGSTIYKDGEPMNTPTTMNWIDEYANKITAELFVRGSAEKEELAQLHSIIITILQNAHTKGTQEALAKVEDIIGKHNARILNEFQLQGKPDMPMIAYDERVCLIPAITKATEETISTLHHLQQLKDNK